jgi:hypothetical protein
MLLNCFKTIENEEDEDLRILDLSDSLSEILKVTVQPSMSIANKINTIMYMI